MCSSDLWQYIDADGVTIVDPLEVLRLNKVGLPPAYQDGLFCGHRFGHVQAVGTDARGRRQYRYHPEFRSARDVSKFSRCLEFGKNLPKIRAQIARDIAGRPNAPETVIAAVVRLLDIAHLRIGNEAYAKSNKSFGATTLRGRHAKLTGYTLSLRYRGKSGIVRSITLHDPKLARVVKRCRELPGQHLFQYEDNEGLAKVVSSTDVNEYLRRIAGGNFTAKDFRTWGGTLSAFEAYIDLSSDGETPTIVQISSVVAKALGNTPNIARKSYIHPAVVGAIEIGSLGTLSKPKPSEWQSVAERQLLNFLRSANGAHTK